MSNANIQCMRGDTTEWTLTVTRDDEPVDLTTAKLWMTARRTRGGTQVFQRSSPSSGIEIDPDQFTNCGKATIKLESSDTDSLPSESVTLYYDVQCKIGSDIWTVVYGNLVVTPDATLETS